MQLPPVLILRQAAAAGPSTKTISCRLVLVLRPAAAACLITNAAAAACLITNTAAAACLITS